MKFERWVEALEAEERTIKRHYFVPSQGAVSMRETWCGDTVNVRNLIGHKETIIMQLSDLVKWHVSRKLVSYLPLKRTVHR